MDPTMLEMMRNVLPPSQFALLTSNPGLMSTLVARLGSTTLSSPDPTQSEEDIKKEIEQITQRYEEEKGRPPRSLPATPRFQLISAWKREREQQEQQQNTAGATMIYKTYCGIPKKYSTTPLSELKPIFLKDMLVNSTHSGCFLLARIVSPAVIKAGVTFVVEDQLGRVCGLEEWAHAGPELELTRDYIRREMLSIYNEPLKGIRCGPELDVLFPIGAILAIREPVYKVAAAGRGSLVRLDSPTDIIRVESGHQLYTSKWKFPSAARAPITDLKTAGNDLFKNRRFRAAVRTYTRGIEAEPRSSALKLIFHLNRAAANLKIEAFRAAHRDAQTVLEMLDAGVVGPDATKAKAILRRAQAEEHMQLNERAISSYEELLADLPASVEGSSGVARVAAKLEAARTGAYDWVTLFNSSMNGDESSRHDVADFLGPCRVDRAEGRVGGRGVFASRDVEVGELLLVEKAFACEFPSKTDLLISLDLHLKSSNTSSQTALVSTVIAKVLDDPSLADVVHSLYAGSDMPSPLELSPSKIFYNLDGPTACDIDTARIEGACTYNSFGGLPTRKSTVEESESNADTRQLTSSSALFIRASFFNHACASNAAWTMYGDVICIRSRTSIKAGDEVLVSYGELEKSKGLGAKHFPDAMKPCKCQICTNDRIDGPLKLAKRRTLTEERFAALQASLRRSYQSRGGPTSRDLQQTQAFVKDLEETYSRSRGPIRLSLSSAYHLAESFTPAKFAEANRSQIKSLEALGLELELYPLSESPNFKIKSLPLASPGSMGAPLLMCAARSHEHGRTGEAARWIAIAVDLEDKMSGGGKEMFKARYGDIVAKMGFQEFVETQL